MNAIPIVVDGPNYINEIMRLGIRKEFLANQLSLRGILTLLDVRVREIPNISGQCETVDFVCSQKRFGPTSARFTEAEQLKFLQRIKAEIGVYVQEVTIPGTREKGVDTTVAGLIGDYAGESPCIVLVSSDRDYIPTLSRIKRKCKVILVSFSDAFPIDLKNAAYATLDLRRDNASLFIYSYPQYDVRILTIDQCAELFANADDRNYNQLRVDNDGTVYISHKYYGAQELQFVKFRFETWVPYNGYVGPIAASDTDYLARQYRWIKEAWEEGRTDLIDY
jgi:hypothetical protein